MNSKGDYESAKFGRFDESAVSFLEMEEMDTCARFLINYFVPKCKLVGSQNVAMVVLILKI